METVRNLKKAKTWNMVLLVLCSIFLIITLFSLPTALNPDPSLYNEQLLGPQASQLYEQANSLQSKVYASIDVVISIAIVVLLFLNNQKLKRRTLASKTPYYLYLGWAVVGIVYSLLFTPSVDLGEMTQMMTIITLVIQILLALPAILTLIYLFKADTEEEI
jgi:hypothetical protein